MRRPNSGQLPPKGVESNAIRAGVSPADAIGIPVEGGEIEMGVAGLESEKKRPRIVPGAAKHRDVGPAMEVEIERQLQGGRALGQFAWKRGG